MKNLFKSLAFLSVLSFFLSSCSEEEISHQSNITETLKTEIIEFRGETVAIPSNFPKELFGQSQKDFDIYYNKISGRSRSKATEDYSTITYENLLVILQKHCKSMPTITSDNEISEKDFERIFNDFPNLKTKEEVNAKREIIFDYYQTLIKPDVARDVATEESSKGNTRVSGISPPSLTDPERNHLISNPGYAIHYVQAATDATSFTKASFGDLSDDLGGRNNAFKHATWNALSIRYILGGAPSSLNQAVDFTQDGTSKHEQNSDGSQVRNHNSVMDLHNNMSAREWMKNETSWGVGPFRSMPSNQDIINTMYSKAWTSAVQPENVILSWHGGNSESAWNNLFNNLYSPNNHLVIIYQ